MIPRLFSKGAVVIPEEQLTIGKTLGEGNFGRVFRGEFRDEHGQKVRSKRKRNLTFWMRTFFVSSFKVSDRHKSSESRNGIEIERRNETRSFHHERTFASVYRSTFWNLSIEKNVEHIDGKENLFIVRFFFFTARTNRSLVRQRNCFVFFMFTEKRRFRFFGFV